MGLDKAARCKQNAFEIQLDVSEIYFRCNLNVFNHRPRQGSWVQTKCVWKYLDVSDMHLDVSDIHLKISLNSYAHKLYKPRRVKELWTRQPFKD